MKKENFDLKKKKSAWSRKTEKLDKQGDTIVVVAGMPFGVSGSTNSIRVVDV